MNEREAWRLIVRHFTGEATASEEAELRLWSRDPANAELMRQVAQVWDVTDSTGHEWDVDAAWAHVAPRLDASVARRPALRVMLGGRAQAQRRVRARRWLQAGGALLAASLALLLVKQSSPVATEPLAFTTPSSGSETVRLPDGTLVRLGPSSRLVVTGERGVALTGLAFFAVEHNPAIPFEVMLPTGVVRVLGTRFEVRATTDSARISVIDGHVVVQGVTEAVELESGEATAIARGGEPARPQDVAPERVASWMGRTLVFQRMPLDEAAAEIESMYGVRVRVAPALAGRTLTALFTDEPLDQLIPTLCRAVVASCTVTDTLVNVEVKE